MSKLTQSPAWQALSQHQAATATRTMRDLFEADTGRFAKFSRKVGGIFADYSKHRIDETTLNLLLNLARDRGVEARRQAMFAGEKINYTEQRAVLHLALRNRSNTPIVVDGSDVMPEVNAVLARMADFSNRVRNGDWLGYTGKTITDVVSIGIGGSDLGPLMVVEALKPQQAANLKVHFVSTVDGAQIADVLAKMNPATTLFVIESKTFTTQETLTNAHTARSWFLAQTGDEAAIAKHFVAVSTNHAAVSAFGIDTANMFGFWDWVGGRFSVWSAIGLPVMLALGPTVFEEILAGGHAMDQHFASAPLAENLPVLMAVLGVWYINFFGMRSHVISPYDQYLHRFPAYLQQMEMESNGKTVDADGARIDYDTCPIIWGEAGINGQHAYYQLLHQGSHVSPMDLIVSLDARNSTPGHQSILLSNILAQGQAFMRGKTGAEVRHEMLAAGVAPDEVERLVPHRTFEGNRPTTTLVLDSLTPYNLGSLIALYEHKVFVQGVIWGINSFDQWGVELGKQLAKNILSQLDSGADVSGHDASTAGLIEYIRRQGGV